ncbi:MAG: c-type cytochrome [Gammaproteobacteria bacterium]|nr:c-type cytochrome [Gammaproteobacteria bacterium]
MFRYLCAILVLLFAPMAALAIPAGTEEEILERIEPVGELCLQGRNCAGMLGDRAGTDATVTAEQPEVPSDAVADTAPGRSGQEVYARSCFACHDAAIAGAPLFGDATQWEPRIAKGIDVLLQSSIVGIPPLMPPRGACMDCSDEELRAAVEYMVDAAR